MRFSIYLSAILALFFTTNTYAIVSMQSLHLETPTPGWKAGLDFNVSGAYGNTNQFRANTGANILYHQNNITRFVALKYTYGESFGVEDQNKSYVHFRRIQLISDRWAWEVFTQLESDKFARLNLRALLGSGARYKLFNTKKDVFYLGAGAFYSIEEIKKLSTDNEGGNYREVKANLYAVYKHDFSENSAFVSTTYLQPVIDDVKDFRLLEDASIRFKLSSKLQMKFSIAITHDNRPPFTVDKTDINYSTGVELSF